MALRDPYGRTLDDGEEEDRRTRQRRVECWGWVEQAGEGIALCGHMLFMGLLLPCLFTWPLWVWALAAAAIAIGGAVWGAGRAARSTLTARER